MASGIHKNKPLRVSQVRLKGHNKPRRLQAFLNKNKPSRASQVRLAGHKKTSNGCWHSLNNKPSRESQVRLKGYKNQGMAAGIPKQKAFKDIPSET